MSASPAADLLRSAGNALESASRLAGTVGPTSSQSSALAILPGVTSLIVRGWRLLAAASAQEDLKAIMRKVQRIEEKERSREILRQSQEAAAASARMEPAETDPLALLGIVSTAGKIEAAGNFEAGVVSLAGCAGAIVDPRVPELVEQEIDDLLRRLESDPDSRDSLARLGEEQSITLQRYLERMSRLMSILHCLLKLQHDSAQGIIQNLALTSTTEPDPGTEPVMLDDVIEIEGPASRIEDFAERLHAQLEAISSALGLELAVLPAEPGLSVVPAQGTVLPPDPGLRLIEQPVELAVLPAEPGLSVVPAQGTVLPPDPGLRLIEQPVELAVLPAEPGLSVVPAQGTVLPPDPGLRLIEQPVELAVLPAEPGLSVVPAQGTVLPPDPGLRLIEQPVELAVLPAEPGLSVVPAQGTVLPPDPGLRLIEQPVELAVLPAEAEPTAGPRLHVSPGSNQRAAWRLGPVLLVVVVIGLASLGGVALLGSPAASLQPLDTNAAGGVSPEVSGAHPTTVPSSGPGLSPGAGATPGAVQPTAAGSQNASQRPGSEPTDGPAVTKAPPKPTPAPIIDLKVSPQFTTGDCKDGMGTIDLVLNNGGSTVGVDWAIKFVGSGYPGDWGSAKPTSGHIEAGDSGSAVVTPAADLCDYIDGESTFSLEIGFGGDAPATVTYTVTP